MLFDDTFKTIEADAQGIFRDKGSKFLAFAYPISSEAEVKSILSNLRSVHSKANHFCYAYRLSPDRSFFRTNDDGEPSGTAGRPILNTMLSADLTNLIIVVVRYFGGTLLGVTGLINAYKSAATDALTNATKIEKTINEKYEIRFDYLILNDVMRLVKEEQLSVLHQQFDNSCVLEFETRRSNLNRVLNRLDKLDHITIAYLGNT